MTTEPVPLALVLSPLEPDARELKTAQAMLGLMSLAPAQNLAVGLYFLQSGDDAQAAEFLDPLMGPALKGELPYDMAGRVLHAAALMLFRAGDRRAAVKLMDGLARLAEHDAQYCNNRAVFFHEIGELNDARAYLNKALALEPIFQVAHRNRMIVSAVLLAEAMSANSADTQTLFNEVSDSKTRFLNSEIFDGSLMPLVYETLGRHQMSRHDMAGAEASYAGAAEGGSREPEVYFQLAHFALQRRDCAAAQSAIEKLSALDPDYRVETNDPIQLRLDLGDCWYGRGEDEAAFQAYERAETLGDARLPSFVSSLRRAQNAWFAELCRGDVIENGPKPRYLAMLSCWGEWFVDLLLNTFVPSLLSEGNLPWLSERAEVTLLIFTDAESKDRLAASENYARLCRYADVRPVLIPPEVLSGRSDYHDGLRLMTATHYTGLRLAKVRGERLITLIPDAVMHENFLRYLHECGSQDIPAVLMTGVRVAGDTFLPDLQARFPVRDGVLSVTATELSELAMRHRHPELDVYTVRDGILNVDDIPHWMHWRYGKNSTFVKAFNVTPLLITEAGMTNFDGAMFWTGDHGMIQALGLDEHDAERCVFVDNSETAIFIDIGPTAKNTAPGGQQKWTARDVGRAARPSNRWQHMHWDNLFVLRQTYEILPDLEAADRRQVLNDMDAFVDKVLAVATGEDEAC